MKPKEAYVARTLGKKVEKEVEDSYEMDRNAAIEEHVRLIKVLRTGTAAERIKEADYQEKELKKIRTQNDD